MSRAAFIGVAIVVLSGTGMQAAAATPGEKQPIPDRPGLVADTRPVPAGISTNPLPVEQDSGLPDGVQDGLWDLYVSHPGLDVNSLEWDKRSGTLRVYTAFSDKVAPLFSKYVTGVPVDLIAAKHSKAEVDEVLGRIANTGGNLGNGQRVVMAEPAKDGSTIALSVETTGGAKRLVAPDATRVLGSDIPLTVEQAPEVKPAMRNIGYYVNLFSGAIMTRPASSTTIQLCTTGFRITNTSTNTPAMLSAEHCGRGNIGSTWYYTTVQVPEASLGQFGGMLSVASGPGAVDTGIWTGGHVDSFYPAVFDGTNDGNSTLTAIRGAVVPVINTSVCYTGARSGNICGNNVTATGLLICYSATQCYANQSITQQTSNVPSAGNGDSGGPVYQSINGQPYGAGIISGIVNGNSACSGDPADANRQCSPTAIFAPLNNALGANNWGFNYVP